MLAAPPPPQHSHKPSPAWSSGEHAWGAGEGAVLVENGGAGASAAERLERVTHEVAELQVNTLPTSFFVLIADNNRACSETLCNPRAAAVADRLAVAAGSCVSVRGALELVVHFQ